MSNNDFLVGRTVEAAIGKSLRQQYSVIPLGNLPGNNGHGPRAMDDSEKGVSLPDFDLAGPHYVGFADVKWKSSIMHYRTWDRDEHGINLTHYEQYLDIEKRFMRRVGLFIAELSTGLILAATLTDLRSFGMERRGYWTDGKPNINWDRKAFAQVGAFEIPNFVLTEMTIQWDWPAMTLLTRQYALEMEQA